MKKIVISLCLLYTTNSCASAVKILSNCLVAGIPSAIFGAYYFCPTTDTYAKQLAVAEKNDYSLSGIKQHCLKENNPLFAYITAVSTISPYVIPVAAGLAAGYNNAQNLYNQYNPETRGATISEIIKKESNSVPVVAGLGAGLACHITIRNALKLLKKVK